MSYIKSQAVSDEAEPAISTSLIIALSVLATIWIFTRLFMSTERKSADVSNCIAGSSDLSTTSSSAAGNTRCTDGSHNDTYSYSGSLPQ